MTADPQLSKRRACTIELKNTAALIRNIYMEGNQVLAEIETLSNQKGKDLANVIARDRINIGFSLRALGSTHTNSAGDIIVETPIKPITYDIVSNPSHVEAHILEFLPENSFSGSEMPEIVYEGVDDTTFLESDSVNLKNINTIQSDYMSDLISENFFDGLKKLKFNF